MEENNIFTVEEVLNALPQMYEFLMTQKVELGLDGLTFNQFEGLAKGGYQNAVLQDQLQKHFRGGF